jgi:hypothetical protein
MLICDKIYFPSAFPMLATQNMSDMYQAIKNVTPFPTKLKTLLLSLPEFSPGVSKVTYTNYNDLMYLFDTLVGNECIISEIR